MKDITDYFSSPTKARKSSDLVENAQKSPYQNVNTDNKIDDDSDRLKVSKDQPKQIKKKRRRKHTDPEIKVVTELLSNNLSLVSPNTSGAKKVNRPSPHKKTPNKTHCISLNNSVQKNESNNINSRSKSGTTRNGANKTSQNKERRSKSNELNKNNVDKIKPTTNDIMEIKDTKLDSQTPKDSTTVNAFQFMMNSRNSIIGQNSSGKLAVEQDSSISEHKTILATRKDLFKNWADQKGALKRKREEEEVGRCIDYKMEKRVKRLKKLLQGKPEDEDYKKVMVIETPVKRKKLIKILSSSDSENSTDLIGNESNKESKTLNPSLVNNISDVVEENAQDTILSISSPPPKKQRENGQNNLFNFFGVLSKESKEERIEVFDDLSKEPSKELIKIKMFTPESTKKRISLFSLNRERTKSLTDESSQESIKLKKHKNKKSKGKEIEEKSKSGVQLNDSLEDFCSPEGKQVKTSVKKFKKKDNEKFKKNGHYIDTKIQCELKENSLKKDANNLLLKSCKDKETNEFKNVDDIKDLQEQKKLKEIKSSDNNQSSKDIDVLVVDESSQDSDITEPKKKKRNKCCIISGDSEDSRSSGGENVLPVEKSIQVSPILKPNRKNSSKLSITNDDSQDPKSEDDVVVVDKSTQNANVTKPSREQKLNDSFQDSTVMTPRTRKKQNTKIKVSKDKMEANQIKQHPNPSGRVLRPKKNNLNYSDLFNDHRPKSPKANKGEKSLVKACKKSSNKNEPIEKIELSSESDYDDTPKKKHNVNLKVAPVFLKATPKPKEDPEVVEARKNFLFSGVPDSLKITIEKQRSTEGKEYDIFPSISHIQQKCQNKFWDLPKPDLQYVEEPVFNPDVKSLACHDLIVRQISYKLNITTHTEEIKNIKTLLNKIKGENPNYPVYKVFRHIYEKSGKNFLNEEIKEKKSPRRRSKKALRKSSEPIDSPKRDTVLKSCEMWSEKYKPRSSEEILGNHIGVGALKNWLETWMNYSEEINSREKKKRSNSNSESEFESTDYDSRDSTRLPGNTMILGGPCGSGKTSAVYAIANELGFNVLELNASSKRTGKKLLQDLQEATQSHQVRKNETNALTNCINPDKSTSKCLKNKKPEVKDKSELIEKSGQKDKKKMCILLVEDIDLVFEQDEGFLTSLFQLITTSKRPIILTTTDSSPAHVQKLLSQYEYMSFMPLSLQCLGVWLQILCLVEGLLVDKDDLGNLLEYNKGDIRKTLLEVQFWSQTGGQLEKNRVFPLKVQDRGDSGNSDLKAADEELKIVLSEENSKENHFVHKHCVGSFEIFRENKEYHVPQYFDLGVLWWNIPNILDVQSCAMKRLNRQKGKTEDNQKLRNYGISENDKLKLNSLLCLYDSLTLTDSLYKTVNAVNSNEPVVKNWLTDVKDSLELTERTEDKEFYLDMVHELTHTLVNGSVENYRNIDETNFSLNLALPDTYERRWRAKQHICEDFLKEPVSLVNSFDRSSIALDYLPTLRDIARYEEKRAASNTKRGNRFRHYLKNLNMNFKESICKLSCNILSVTDNND